MEYYILVAGNGNTTRANVEALIDDHFIANGDDGTLVLAFDKAPSPGQKWAAQFAKDNGKQILLFAGPDAGTVDCPNNGLSYTANPLQKAVESITGQDSVAFLLWHDEDDESVEALRMCKDSGIRCFDLTSGLYEITPSANIEPVEKPQIPQQEMIEEPEEEDDEEEMDDEEEEVEIEQVLTDAVTVIAQMFAQEIAAELKKLMGK